MSETEKKKKLSDRERYERANDGRETDDRPAQEKINLDQLGIEVTDLVDTNTELDMRRLVLVGRSECGKTTLKQVLRGEKITYQKTQYVSQYDVLIDMPGEYAENLDLAHAIALYTSESDVVGICISATEPYSLYPPNVTPYANRDIFGIVTKIDHWAADVDQAIRWLELTGCKLIFPCSSYTGEGVDDIIDFLKIKHEKKTVTDVMHEINVERFGKLTTLPSYFVD